MIWALAILFALFITFVLTRRLLLPIRILDSAAQEVSRGNYDFRVPVVGSDEMGRLGRTFNAMLASIRSSREELIRQERITTLGRVASSIVHDLRNPLAAIYGGAEMLIDADGLPVSYTKRLAENIYRASGQIRTLLDDLTAITRGKAPELETCRIADVVDDAWSSVEPQADAAGVSYSIDGALDHEAPVPRARIERVFVNLFTNAIQAMPAGGRIAVRLSREGNHLAVQVQDSGPGVPANIRENLFQPFTTSGKANGLGLGLALSRHTLLDHGGDLSLDTTASGACFRVTLPLHPAPAKSAQLAVTS
jgi:signal transduction histidine kinase